MSNLERVWEALSGARSVLVVTHLSPDGDAVSSVLALGWILRSKGVPFRIVNQDACPELYSFLPGFEWIERWNDGIEISHDVVAALDCGRKNRVGLFLDGLSWRTLVNVDHHISNDAFGEVNWIEAGASSTGEMLFDLACHAGVPMVPELANCVYTAILTDTGNFNFANTSARCHALASRLIECGASPAWISRHLYRSRTLGRLKIQARLIQELEVDLEKSLAYAVLTQKMCREAGVNMNEILDLVTIPLSVDGVVLGILFRELEEPGWTKVSFRSEGDLDVSLLARELGGGGHPSAAGCTLQMEVHDAVALVLPLIQAGLAHNSAATMVRRVRALMDRGGSAPLVRDRGQA